MYPGIVAAPGPTCGDALLGEVVARATAFPRRDVARTLLEQLDPRPEDAVLELGFGSGRLLAAVAARVRRGLVVGVDPSEWMERHARLRNARAIREGRIQLVRGRSDDLRALPAGLFDHAYGVHVVCFWSDPAVHLREIRRVLRPGGRLLLGFSPAAAGPGERSDRASIDPQRLAVALAEAGFGRPTHALRTEGVRPLYWLSARRNDPAA